VIGIRYINSELRYIKMKIAICFSGQTRTSTLASINLKRFIGDLWDQCDFFIHTWDIEQLRSKHCGPTAFKPRPITKVPKSRFDELIQIYQPKKIEIENYNECLSEIESKHGKLSSGNNWFPLFYSWQKSVLLAAEYQQYDVIVKLRTDVIFPSYRSLQNSINQYNLNQEIFLVDNLTDTRIDDVFWVASTNNMLKASEYWAYLYEYYLKNDFKRLEFIDYMKMININCEKITNADRGGYSIYREECKHLNPLNFKQCYDCEQIYYGSIPPFIWHGPA